MLKNKILATIGGGEASDPHFKNVALLLHGDGTNGAQNNTFVDSSPNNFTITRNGNPTQGSFSPYGDRWSNALTTSSCLTAPSNSAFNLGTGDFTVECWVFRNDADAGYQTMLGFDVTGGLLFEIYGNQLDFGLRATQNNASGVTVPSFQWVHLALSRQGSSVRYFQNGALIYTYTGAYATANITNSTQAIIGGYTTAAGRFNGHISNLRLVKGTALYTANFTPSTTPLTAISGTSLLTCQSNRFKDNSSNNHALTSTGDVSVSKFSPFAPTAAYSSATDGASGYFDGSGDYLSFVGTTASNIANIDATIEFYLYANSISNNPIILSTTSENNSRLHIGVTSAGSLRVFDGISTTASSDGVIPIRQWCHIAVCIVNSSSTFALFVNGQMITAVGGYTGFVQGTWLIGKSAISTSNNLSGYLSGLRVLKGTWLYTANFTPPTSPPTAITNTALLLNFTNAGLFDHAGLNDLETVGNVQAITAQKKYGTASMYFDGTGDYLVVPDTPALNLSRSLYTIEAFIYLLDTSDRCIFSKGGGSYSWSATNGFEYSLFQESGSFFFQWNIGGGTLGQIQTSIPSRNEWHHVAVTYDGTTVRLFIDGVSVGTSSGAIVAPTTSNLIYVGTRLTSNGNFNGYIDDLRITKGVARYTANFTPPTAAFPNK